MDLCHQHFTNWLKKIHQSCIDSMLVPRDTPKCLQKAPDPEKPEICPETAFPQEKINTGRRPRPKSIFPCFRIERQKCGKNCYCGLFWQLFGPKTCSCRIFIAFGNHNPAAIDTIQLVRHVNIKVWSKTTIPVEQHVFVVLCKHLIYVALIVIGGTIHV